MFKAKEQKKIEQAAHEFARRAKPGRTYYRVVEITLGPRHGRWLSEIEFKKPSRSSKLLSGFDYPRWYGPHTAADCYLQQGPLYEDRNHPAIRELLTFREQAEVDEEFERQMLNSPQWRKELDNIASGTAFSVNWPKKK